MKSVIQIQAEILAREYRKRKLWQWLVYFMGVIVVFCTTYALILPAITWERSLICEIPEHLHDDSCYESVLVPAHADLVCDKEHTHTDECYVMVAEHTEKTLVCKLEEHEHAAACYDAQPSTYIAYYCNQVEHVHSVGQGCYMEDGVTIQCTIPEHMHTEDCLKPSEPVTEDVLSDDENMNVTEDSEVTEPENSEVTKSEGSKVTKPENSEVTKSEGSKVTKPENSEVTKSEGGEVTESENSEVTKSEGGEATESENSEVTEPEDKKVAKPEDGEVTEPENTEVTEHEDNEDNTVHNITYPVVDDRIFGYELYPDNSALTEKLMAALPQETVSDGVYVVAASDFQDDLPENVASGNARMVSLFNSVGRNFEANPYAVFFGGDYSRYPLSEAVSHTDSRISDLDAIITDRFGSSVKRLYIQGNHDYPSAAGLSTQGAHDTSYYGAFVIDYSTYPAGSQSAQKELANKLENYLAAKAQAGYTKPVFVLTHVPFHHSERIKQDNGKYAKYFYDACYKYGDSLNIIVLVAHNHSGTYDDYLGGSAFFFTDGDYLPVPDEGTTSTFTKSDLNFTYMNYGYVGFYGAGSSSSKADRTVNTMSVSTFEIDGDDEVTVTRWNENGKTALKKAGTNSKTYGDYTGTVGAAYKLTPPSPDPDPEIKPEKNTYTDTETGISADGIASGIQVENVTDIVTPKDVAEGYAAYKITVTDLDGSAEITIPLSKDCSYDTVWTLMKDGTLAPVENAVFEDGKVSFTTDNSSATYIIGTPAGADTDPDTSEEERLEDKSSGILVDCNGSDLTVRELKNSTKLDAMNVSSYHVYDIKVADFTGTATVYLPLEEGNDSVWYLGENEDDPCEPERQSFTVCTVDGKKYARFETTHFSDWGVGTSNVTYWQKLTAADQITSDGTYMIVRDGYALAATSANDNAALSGVDAKVTVAEVTGASGVYTISGNGTFANFEWKFVNGSAAGTITNVGTSKKIALDRGNVLSNDGNPITVSYNSNAFRLSRTGQNTYYLSESNGTFSRQTNTNTAGMDIYKLTDAPATTTYWKVVSAIDDTSANYIIVNNTSKWALGCDSNGNRLLTDPEMTAYEGFEGVYMTTLGNEYWWKFSATGNTSTQTNVGHPSYGIRLAGNNYSSPISTNKTTNTLTYSNNYWTINSGNYYLRYYNSGTTVNSSSDTNNTERRQTIIYKQVDKPVPIENHTVKTGTNNSSTVYTVDVFGILVDDAGNPVSRGTAPEKLGTVTVNSGTTSSSPVVPETAFNGFAASNDNLAGTVYVTSYFGTEDSVDRNNVTALYRYGNNDTRYLGLKYNNGSDTENRYLSASDPKALYVKYKIAEPHTVKTGQNNLTTYTVNVYGIQVDDAGNPVSPGTAPALLYTVEIVDATRAANPVVPKTVFETYAAGSTDLKKAVYVSSYFGTGNSVDKDNVTALFMTGDNTRYLGLKYNNGSDIEYQYLSDSDPKALYVKYKIVEPQTVKEGTGTSAVYKVNVYGIEVNQAGTPVDASAAPKLLKTITIDSDTNIGSPVIPKNLLTQAMQSDSSLAGATYFSSYFGTMGLPEKDKVTAVYSYYDSGEDMRYLGLMYNNGSNSENKYLSDSNPACLYVNYTMPSPNTWMEGSSYKVNVYGIHVDAYGNVLSDTPILLDTITVTTNMGAPWAVANPYADNAAYLPGPWFLKYVDNGVVSGEYAGSYFGTFVNGENGEPGTRVYDTKLPDHAVQGESADGVPDGVDALYSYTQNNTRYLGVRYLTGVDNKVGNTIDTFIQRESPEALYIQYKDKQEAEITYDYDKGKAPDHRKYIDSFRDGDPNPDTELDQKATDLTDLYRVYLDLGPESAYEPVDVLIMLDLSNSMSNNTDAVDLYDNTTSRINALWGMLYGMRQRGDYTTDTLDVGNSGREGLLKKIIDMNPDNEIAVTFFSEKAENGIQKGSSGSTDLSEYHTEVLDWFKAGDWNTNNMKPVRFMPPNGTNYTAAMIKMQDMLKEKANDGRKKIIIFMSDGEPNYFTYGLGGNLFDGVTGKLFPANSEPIEKTHFYTGDNMTYPQPFYDFVRYWDSSSTPSADTYDSTINAITNFKGWMAKQGDIILNTIAIGAANYFFLDEMPFGGEHFGGNNFSNMLNAMEDMVSHGAGHYTELKVVDRISPEVEFYQSDKAKEITDPVNADFKVYMTDKEGNKTVLYQNNSETNENQAEGGGKYLTGLTVGNDGTITATFQNVDTPLMHGLKFTVSYNIETRQESYDVYSENVKNGDGADDELNGYLKNKGAADTDYEDSNQQNETSSLKPGWNANNYGNADGDADADGTGRALLYYKQTRVVGDQSSDWKFTYFDHPVVQVWTTDMEITKTWSDGAAAHANDSVTLEVWMKELESDFDPDAAITESVRTGGNKVATVTLSAENSWKYTLTDLPRGYYFYVKEVIDDSLTDYKQIYSPYAVAIPHNATEDMEFSLNVTNTDEQIKYLVLKKTDRNGYPLENAQFKLYSDAQHSQEVQNQLVSSNSEGVFTPANFTLEAGTYYLVETKAPDGYRMLTDDVCIVVTDEGITASYGNNPLTLSSKTGDDKSVTYTLLVANSPGKSLPTTGGAGTLPFILCGLLIVAVTAFGYNFYRRRERRS